MCGNRPTSAVTTHRPSVNWFSPLSPERSGIAEFTAAIAPVLRARTDARFVTQASIDDTAEHLPNSQSLVGVTAADLNRADINIYNIGNNATFHADIWRLSCVHPGIVILHDFRLQHLFGGMFLVQQRRREEYVALMRDIYGPDGEAAAIRMAMGRISPEATAEEFPLVEVAVRGAAGVVVHSQEALDAVRSRTGVPAVKLHLPYAPSATVSTRRRNWRSDRPSIVAFGHIGPNRRIDSVLQALARLEPSVRPDFHLIGTVWNERRVQECARELAVSDRLHVHGHLPDDKLDIHLAGADLAINLRWPSMGEASYSLLRAWDHGVPTLVTDTGWYGEITRDAVIHVDPQHEIDSIVAVMRRCVQDRGAFEAVGRRGRETLLHLHGIDDYVNGLLAFAANVTNSTTAVQRKLASAVARALTPYSDDSATVVLNSMAAALHAAR